MNLRHTLTRIAGFVMTVVALQLSASAQMLTTRVVVDSLSTPWEIVWGPDDWIWVTERGGRISRVDAESGTVQTLFQIPDVEAVGEAGLLGMAIKDSAVYVVYTYRAGDLMFERLVRYRFTGTTLVEPTTLLDSIGTAGIHAGSRVIITPDDKILMTTGDGGLTDGQDHMTPNAKVLRMNLDGSAPADNPWPDAPHPARLLWATGLRNSQGLVLAPSGILYASEHGANSDDEINIIRRGRNYGWSAVQGYCDTDEELSFCRDSNVVEPIRAWTPTIAPAGLDYYDHPAIPGWHRSLLLATLKQSDVRLLQLSPDGSGIVKETIFHDPLLGRARDLCIDPNGRVFVATMDRIIEIAPKPGELEIGSPTIEAARFRAGEPFTVRFTVRGPAAPGNRYTISLFGPQGRIILGWTTDTGDVVLDGIFDCTTRSGAGFRLRLDSEFPESTVYGAQEPLAFVGTRRATITSPDQSRACMGDTVTLVGVEGVLNRWSTGDTTLSIRVTEQGRYHLQIVDGACSDSTWMNVGFSDTAKPQVSWISTWKMFSVDGFYRFYQWYHDGQEIPGATLRNYLPTAAGQYWVRTVGDNGCWGSSNAVEFNPSLVHDDARRGGPIVHLRTTEHELWVTVDSPTSGAVAIDVTDVRGEVVRSTSFARSGGRAELALPIGDLTRGVYVARVRIGSSESTRKFIVTGSK